MGFSGSSGPSQPTICVTGSTHPNSFSSCAAASTERFSAEVPSSRSSVSLARIEGAREGTAVLTAVSGSESKISLSMGVEDSGS